LTTTSIHSLPGAVRVRLDQTIAQWRHWQCEPPLESRPEPDGILGNGVSNYSVLVGTDRRFVVRIDGVDPTANGLHRQLEWRALLAASSARLAPTPRYFNPELGSLVCDYLPPDADQTHTPAQTGALLGRIHGLPRLHQRLDLGERITRLEKILAHRGDRLPPVLSALRGKVFSLLDRLGSREETARLCHNDLLAANRLLSGGVLWAVDWEYCAMGSPWYDLAVITCGDALDEGQVDELLRSYLGRAPRATERARLADYGRVYRYLELLWYRALQKQPGEPFLEQRSAALVEAWRSC
jgi:thiamine kinase-like enzyme